MKAIIHPSKIKGVITAPRSKSSMQRALAAAFLTHRDCWLENPGYSNDDKAAINIIKALGGKVEAREDDGLLLIGRDGTESPTDVISCGESGLSMRMFTPIISLYAKPIVITGEGSLLNRPMDFFDEVLPQLGVQVQSTNGKLPLTVQGPLQPRDITVDGSLSSQFLTGLLFAYCAAGAADVTIHVNNLTSKPYIDLTLDVIKHFGLGDIENRNYESFYFKGTTVESNTNYSIEGDWSGGAFLLVAGCIAGPVTVRGLDLGSKQADRAVVDAIMNANGAISMTAKGIEVRPAKMNGFEFDATHCPDLFPPLVALAAYCEGDTIIQGVNRLIHKESNRAITLQEEFGKMNVHIDLKDDYMVIHGNGNLNGAVVHSHHDHRIAMACAVAALKANGPTTIEEAAAIDKSYPDFYEDLKKLGADVSLSNKIKWHE